MDWIPFSWFARMQPHLSSLSHATLTHPPLPSFTCFTTHTPTSPLLHMLHNSHPHLSPPSHATLAAPPLPSFTCYTHTPTSPLLHMLHSHSPTSPFLHILHSHPPPLPPTHATLTPRAHDNNFGELREVCDSLASFPCHIPMGTRFHCPSDDAEYA